MKAFASVLLAAGLCLAVLAGCGGENADDKPKSKTEPYHEVGVPKSNTPPMTKDGKAVGFQ